MSEVGDGGREVESGSGVLGASEVVVRCVPASFLGSVSVEGREEGQDGGGGGRGDGEEEGVEGLERG